MKADKQGTARMGAAAALAAIAMFSFATSAHADNYRWNHGVNSRQARQQSRIRDGVKDGELTNKEAYRLEKRQAQLANQEARLRASGNGLSPYERAKLEREQNRLSKSIHNQKHDGQDRIR